ncbi:MAG: hypothetical protein KGQ58_06880 [Proteobacteria bacterium]|nr:hypothetical protein [Pseudomonadota bacterium]
MQDCFLRRIWCSGCGPNGTGIVLARQADVFVSRLGHLENTVGVKLLPLLWVALGETAAFVVDHG